MNIVVSGMDSVGKSTLIDKLVNKYDMDVIHSTASTSNTFEYHINLLDYHDNTCFDRFHTGEIIFPYIYGREPKLTFEEFDLITKRIIDNNDLYIIMISSDLDILNKRLLERGENDYLAEMSDQLEYYKKAIERVKKFNYKNFYVCDISEDSAYDRLDDWIDSHFGKINVNVAYRKVCKDLVEKGHTMETRNIRGNTKELCNYTFTITDIEDPIITLKTGKCDMNYLAGETLWYWNSRNDMDFIGKFGKMWTKLSDDGVHNNSAYGYIMKKKHGFNQIEKIIELLTVDPYSRRAVININVPNPNVIDTKDEMCTICLIYQIRDNKLHCTCVMRSNDIKFGTRNDLGFFLTLQKYIANRLNVGYGTYTHFAASIHVYDSDFKYIKDVAYGTMERVDEVLDVDELLNNNDYLIDYVDNYWVNREDFTRVLKEKNIIKKVEY